MISVNHLTKTYKGNKKSGPATAVNNISFECVPGRIFALLGPNGAGKTTLLRMMATILQPTDGYIMVEGIDTQKNALEVKRRIGFLTNLTNLYGRLTPEETVKYFADLHQIPENKYVSRKQQLFEQLGINEFANKKVNQLSSGMKQKVSIARTMIHDPQVVIFDEPTTGLDVITASGIIELIKDCRNQGKTVIFSSHVMGEVELLGDDLAIVHQGNLIYNDSMDHFKQTMKANSLTEEFINRIHNP